MKKIIIKIIGLIVIWAIAYAVVYLGGIPLGRSEVSEWGFCLSVGFTIGFGPKIYNYVIKKFNSMTNKNIKRNK